MRGYHISNNALYFDDTYVAQTRDTITLMVDIDPDAPMLLKHGCSAHVEMYAKRIRTVYNAVAVRDRWTLGVPMMYTLPINADTIALANDVIERMNACSTLSSTIERMRAQYPDIQVHSAITQAASPTHRPHAGA